MPLEGVNSGGTYTVDLDEGTDLTVVKQYTIKIVVDNHTSNLGYVTVWDLKSETVSTIPADRTRTTLGIGEQAQCSIVPAGVVGNWSKTGDGSLSATPGNSVTFIRGRSRNS